MGSRLELAATGFAEATVHTSTRQQARTTQPTQDGEVLIMNVEVPWGDLHCSRCGYGIAPHARLPQRCPMCGGDSTCWIARPAVAVLDRFAALERLAEPKATWGKVRTALPVEGMADPGLTPKY